jgi:hypothetical protein
MLIAILHEIAASSNDRNLEINFYSDNFGG